MTHENNTGLWPRLYKGAKMRLSKAVSSPYQIFDINWIEEKYYKHATKGKLYTHKYKNNLPVHFTDPQAFLLSVRELFIDKIYKFKSQTDAPVILDCGAHIGMSILFFKTQFPNARITAFEPDTHNFNLAKKNVSGWKFTDVEIIPKAVWTSNGNIQFHQSGDMGSSIIEDANHSENTVQIPCVRLKDYLTSKIDFLKLDIEGAEFAVINDCKDELHKIDNLFIEYHGTFSEMHKLNSILNIVVEQGFSYYIKEAGNLYQSPFFDTKAIDTPYDVQLNIFCFKPNK